MAFRAASHCGALAVGEPEVVDHDFVEQPGGVLEDRLEPLLGGHVGVAGDALPARGALADAGGRDAAGDLEARRLEPLLGMLECLALGLVAVAEGLDVDLGHGRLPAPVDGRVDAAFGREIVPHLAVGKSAEKPLTILSRPENLPP